MKEQIESSEKGEKAYLHSFIFQRFTQGSYPMATYLHLNETEADSQRSYR